MFEAPNLHGFKKNGLEFFKKKNLENSKHFFFKKLSFLGGKTWAIGKPHHPANGPSKNIWGILVEKIEFSTNMSKKSFFLYYEMKQNYNFMVKTKSFITQRFLNQSG